MALSFSNTLGNALNNTMSPTSLSTPATNNTSLWGQISNAVKSNNNVSVGAPAGGYSIPTAPATTSTPQITTPKPPTTSALAAPASTSAGTYKGVTITPGTDQQVAAQVAAIDASQSGASPTSTSGALATAPTANNVSINTASPTYNPTTGSTSSTPTQSNNGASPTQTPTYSGLVGGLANNATSNPAVANATGALSDFQKQMNNEIAGVYAEPGLAQDLSGHAQAIQQANAQTYSGLQTAVQNALLGQQNTTTGLNDAAQLAQPSQAAYGQTAFNPLTGTYSSDAGGLPAGTLQQYAQMAANGQYSAIPSSITGNIALNAQLNQAAQQINPNYNPITSAAQGAATASNVETSGTAATNIANTGATSAVQSYNALNAANSTFDNQASSVLSVLQNGSLNGSIPDVNAALNAASNKLGSTQVQALQSSLTELGAAYTNLLSSNGGTPTAQDQQALAALNPSSSAAQIATSIQQLQQAAQIKLQSAQALASGYGSALSGGASGSTNYNF